MSIIDIYIYKLYISEADSMTAAPFRNFPGLNGDGNLNFFSRGWFFFSPGPTLQEYSVLVFGNARCHVQWS